MTDDAIKKTCEGIELLVLAADDEIAVLNSLKRLLARACKGKYTVVTASDGKEAIERVDGLVAERKDLAVVISDYLMPHHNGGVVLDHVRNVSPQTMTILLSGTHSGQDNSRYADYSIEKPWDSRQLVETVDKCIKEYEQMMPACKK